MRKKIAVILLVSCFLAIGSIAQTTLSDSNPTEITQDKKVKGFFFITPIYQYSYFDNIELESNTNYYTMPEGNSSDVFSEEDISEYNNQFGTSYNSSMLGLKIGYQVLDGLGISAYAGINHFNFESWKTEDNEQSLVTEYPSLTMGVYVDYEIKVNSFLSALTFLSYNYTTTRSVLVENKFSENVATSKIKTNSWEANIAMVYRAGKFLPYAGVGFAQCFLNTVIQEEIQFIDEEGQPFTEKIEFDSHFKGQAFYGLIGMEYLFNKNFSVYTRVAFPNPARLSLGIKFII